jgi:hypothetical protein
MVGLVTVAATTLWGVVRPVVEELLKKHLVRSKDDEAVGAAVALYKALGGVAGASEKLVSDLLHLYASMARGDSDSALFAEQRALRTTAQEMQSAMQTFHESLTRVETAFSIDIADFVSAVETYTFSRDAVLAKLAYTDWALRREDGAVIKKIAASAKKNHALLQPQISALREHLRTEFELKDLIKAGM